MPELLAIAGGIPVIEDCAQAHGATLAGRRAGSWGLAGCYSFYPTKNLGAYGDAGAVVTNDAGVAGRVRALREYGWTSRFHSEVKGGRNSRMDEVQAALLGARLPLLDGWNARRREIARRYDEALGGAAAPERAGDVVHLYVFQCDGRDGLRERLRERGVATEVHYPIPDYRQASQSGQAFRSGSLAVTERCTARIVSLPCFPELTDDEVAYVVECLRAACGHGG
jgi:dTDP-4-amino-4,6-dideoxygalactose transaminase